MSDQKDQVITLLLIAVRALYREDAVTPSVTCSYLGGDFYASVVRYKAEAGAPVKKVVCAFRAKTLSTALAGLSNKWLVESWYPNRREMLMLAKLVMPPPKKIKWVKSKGMIPRGSKKK